MRLPNAIWSAPRFLLMPSFHVLCTTADSIMNAFRRLPQLIADTVQLWKPSLPLIQTTTAIASCNSHHLRPIHTQPRRQLLSRYARGVKVWEEARAAEETDFAFEAVCNGMIENMKVNRHARSSNITKIFDHVTTAEQLDLAEKVLMSFRRSLSRPTTALPLVIVRACIRVGESKRALGYIKDKVQYGIFPAKRVFHVLMDTFIREGDPDAAIAVYEQMLTDEVDPDGMTFHLASRAHVLLNTPEGVAAATSFCRQCYELEPKLGSKSYLVLIKTLLHQVNRREEAHSLITQLDSEQLLLPQTRLNLLTHVLVEIGKLDRTMTILKERLCVPLEEEQQLGLPQEAWLQLTLAVQDSRDEELIRKLENLTEDLIACKRHSPS